MAFEWLNDKDEPKFSQIKVKDDGLERANPEIAALHNGLIDAENLVTGAVMGIPAAISGIASTTPSAVGNDIAMDMEGYGDLDPSLQQGVQTALNQAHNTTAPVWSGIESGIRDAREAITPNQWAPSEEVGAIRGGADAILQAAPQMAMQAAAGAFGGPLVGGALMGLGIGGDQYFRLRDKNVSPTVAATAGTVNAAIQSVLEKTGMEPWLNARTILKNHGLLKAIGTPFLSEGLTEAIQEVPDELTSYYAEHGTLEGFDYGQLGLNAAEAGLVGGFYGALFGGIGAAMGRRQNGKTVEASAEPPQEAADNQVTNVPPDGQEPIYTPTDNSETQSTAVENTDMPGNVLAAIAGQESGGESDPYSAENGLTGAHGKYQITPDTWDTYADAAGVGKDAEKTPENQERVARYMMQQYINDYGVDGAIIAWYAGPGTAETYVNGRMSDEALDAPQEGGPSIRGYLNSVKSRLGNVSTTAQSESQSAVDFLQEQDNMPLDTPEGQQASENIRRVIDTGTKEEQEALARELGWQGGNAQNAQEGTQEAPQAAGRVNTQPNRQNAPQAPSVAPVANAQVPPVRPIQTAQGNANTALDVATNIPAAPITNAPAPVGATNTRGIIPQQQAPRRNGGTPVWASNQKTPVQAPAGPLAPVQAQKQEQPYQAKRTAVKGAPTKAEVDRIMKNKTVAQYAQAAFTNGDQEALAKLQAQYSPELLAEIQKRVVGGNNNESTESAQNPQPVQRMVRGTEENPVQNAEPQNAQVQEGQVNQGGEAARPVAIEPGDTVDVDGKRYKVSAALPNGNFVVDTGNGNTQTIIGDQAKRAKKVSPNGEGKSAPRTERAQGEAPQAKAPRKGKRTAQRDEVVAQLEPLFGKPIVNKETGISAKFSRTGANKMVSGAALKKSNNNGFTDDQHFAAVKRIKELFENASLAKTHPDKNGAENVISIKRFVAPVFDGANALITVKETKQHGHSIYSLELEQLEKAPTEKAPSAFGEMPRKESSHTDGALSTVSVAESTEEVKGEDSPWGSTSNEAIDDTFEKMRDSLRKEAGITEEEETADTMPVDDDVVESVAKVDSSDKALEEEVAKLKAALKSSFNRLNSTPLDIVFDPNIWVPAFHIGEIYIKRGARRFADFQKELVSKIGDEIKPWIKSIWEAAKVYPDGVELSNESLGIVIRGAGQIYYKAKSQGKLLTQAEMEAEFKKRLGDNLYNRYKQFVPVAYKAVSTFETPKDKREKARKLKTATVRTDDGKEFGVTYKIVPADSLVASNTWDFGVNEKYPAELQPRDRSRTAMKEQVDNMARNLRPADLAEARSVNEGAPVINGNNVVENGNGRTMAISRAYHYDGDSYRKSAAGYKAALVKDAEKYGYTADEVRNMKNPVLVRQRTGKSADLQESIINSTNGGMKMGAGQQAKADAKKLTNNTLRKYNYDGSGDLTLVSNRDFVVSALNEMVDASDRDVVFDRNGIPTQAGIQRVRSALTALAYGDSTLLDRMSESTDEANKTVVNAFVAAAPRVAVIRNRINQGTIDKDHNLPDALGRVVSFYLNARDNHQPVENALNETSLFGDEPLHSKGEKDFVRFINDAARQRAQKRISNTIVDMVNSVETANEGSGSLFEGSPANLSGIMQQAVEKNTPPKEGSLFEQKPEPKAESTKEVKEEESAPKKTGIAFIDNPDSLINQKALEDPNTLKVVDEIFSKGPHDKDKVIALIRNIIKDSNGNAANYMAANIVQQVDEVIDLYNSHAMSKEAARKQLQETYDAFKKGGGRMDQYPGSQKFTLAILDAAIKEVDGKPAGEARYLVMGRNFGGETIGNQIVLAKGFLNRKAQMLGLPPLSTKDVSITIANEPGLMKQAEEEFPRAWKVEDIGNGLLRITSPRDHINDANYADELREQAYKEAEAQRAADEKRRKELEENAYNGFLKGKPPMTAKRIKNILDTLESVDGKTMRRGQFIEDMVKNHPNAEIGTEHEVTYRKVHLETIKTVAKNLSYFVYPDGKDGISYKITKTEADYFNFLKENGKMKADNSTDITNEGGTGNAGRVPGSGRPDEVRGPGESSAAGGTGRETAGRNRQGETGSSGRERGQRAGGNEPADAGRVQERPEKAGRGTGVQSDDSHGNEGGRTPGLVKESISPKVDHVEDNIAKGKMKDATDTRGHDYHYEPKTPTDKRSKTKRRDDNIAAIKLLKKLESENRKATPAEQEILASYSGWGGLTFAFEKSSPDFKQKIYDDLKGILTEEEFNNAVNEANTAFYTPDYVVQAMWNIVRRLGFNGGRVLDPSCATGKFFALMPKDMEAKSTTLQGIELSSIPARIASQLFQGRKYNIENTGYQKFDPANKRGIVARDNYYDLAITNVPFSDVPIRSDKTVKGVFNLHNFYFAKTVNKVRPGGLIIFMTSHDTMDGSSDAMKLRRQLAQTTELVGAFRLPTTLFKGTGAKITTDIIVLRKLNEGEAPKAESWKDASPTMEKARWGRGEERNDHLVELVPGTWTYGNEYFQDHPKNVIGKMEAAKDRYGRNTVEVVTKDDAETGKLLDAAVKTLPAGIYQPRTGTNFNTRAQVTEATKANEGDQVGDIRKAKDGSWGHVTMDGKGNLTVTPYAKSQQATVKDWMAVNDALTKVLQMQVDPATDEKELAQARKALNTAYDNFVKKHGYLNDAKNRRLFDENIGAYRVYSIEDYKKDAKGLTVKKTGIFTKRTAEPAERGEIKIENAGDALLASQLKFGHVDIDYIAKELHKTPQQVEQELGNKIFKDPDSGNYVARDEYLSGNVREKLVQAELAAKQDPAYLRNVEELKAVIPKDLKVSSNASDGIALSLGMSPDVVPVPDVQAFVDHLTGIPGAITISYSPVLSKWTATPNKTLTWKLSDQITYTKYGVEGIGKSDGIPVWDVIQACFENNDLMGRSLFKTQEDDSAATIKAREQAMVKARDVKKKVQQEFTNFIVGNPEIKERVENNYNNRYNATVLRTYDGSFLEKGLNWLNKAADIHLRSHQLNAVWRTLCQRATLYAHCVGSGKTWTMQAAGMELKRLGIAHKIVYTTPKNVVAQFVREFYALNPSAKILVLDSTTLPPTPRSIEWNYFPVRVLKDGTEIIADTKEKEKMGRAKLDEDGRPVEQRVRASAEEQAKRRAAVNKRNATLHKIKVNDWDAIVMSHETFKAIPMSDDYMAQFLQNELEKYRAALNEQKILDEEATGSKKKSKSVKDIEKNIERLEERLSDLMEHKKYDMGLDTFESLGIDQLFVDEADVFKNLAMPTGMSRISGISTSGSQAAEDMYAKTQYLMNSNNTHGVVFATGTPISNSVTELYTMCRYLAGAELDRLGINSFDQFAKMFINIGQGISQKSDGSGFEYKNMVLGLQNAPECIKLFRSFADIQTIQDLPEIMKKLPKVHRVTETIPVTNWWKGFKKRMVDWFNEIRSTPLKERKGKMNFLSATNAFRDATYSPFIVDKNAPAEEAFARAWKCADNVAAEYEKSKDVKGAQVIFCDKSVPKAGKFSIYNVIKQRLVEKGIPADEIAFVPDSSEARAEVFQKVNEGEIRVLIGSTEKMGAGTNMQKHLVALHHFDCPWRPRDIEQREGRIVRQGNENKDVTIYSYVTQGSYDGNLWDRVKNKALVINQVMHGDPNLRTVDARDYDENNFAQNLELSQESPEKKRQAEAIRELGEAQAQKTAYENAQRQANAIVATYPDQIAKDEKGMAKVQDDIALRNKTGGDKFLMKIGNETFDNQNKANEAVTAEKESIAKGFAELIRKYGYGVSLKDVKIGTCKGFDIYASGDNSNFRANPDSINLELVIKGSDIYKTGGTNTARGVWNAIFREPDRRLSAYEHTLERQRQELADAKEALKDAFDGDAKIEALKKEIDDLGRKIDAASKETQAEATIGRNAATVETTIYNADDEDATVEGINSAFRESLSRANPDGERGNDPTIPLSISFDKPLNWDEFKSSYIDRTGWTVTEKNGEVTIETTSGEMDNLSSTFEDPELDFRDGEEHYLVTNRNITSNTSVRVIDLDGYAVAKRINNRDKKDFGKAWTGQTFTIADGGIDAGFASSKDTRHFYNSSDDSSRNKGVRRRVIANDSLLKSVIENSVYVEQSIGKHKANAGYFVADFYAAVRLNGRLSRIKIVARIVGNNGYDVQSVELYDLMQPSNKKEASLAKPQVNAGILQAKDASSADISIAELLSGVNDRNGHPYVTNGRLNYDGDIFKVSASQLPPGRSGKNLIDDRADNTIHYSREALQTEVMSNFPNAQNVQTSDEGMEFNLPNGHHMTVRFQDGGITVDRAQASKDYGREIGANETARGSMRITTNRDGIMTLTVDTVEQTPAHEAMHFAMQFLTPRERAALLKLYKNEEAICEGMREWKIARQNHKGTLLGKIFQRISDFAYKVLGLFHETDRNIFRKVSEGQMWERKSDNASAAKVSYSMNLVKVINDYFDSNPNFVKPGETRQVEEGISVRGRKADSGWTVKEIFGANLFSPSRIKAPIVRRLHEIGSKATRVMAMRYAEWSNRYGKDVISRLKTDKQKKQFDDLLWAEDAAQHEFTAAELREEGYDEDVIAAHDAVRKILKDIYEKVNDVYTRAVAVTHSYNTRAEAEKAVAEANKLPYTKVLGQIYEVKMKSGRVRYQVTIKAPHSWKHVAIPMTRSQLKEIQADKYNHIDHITKLEGGKLLVDYTSFAKPLTNLEGYVPHVFHDFMVIAKRTDEHGEEHSEVIGSATSQKEAIKVGEEYRAKHQDEEILIAPKEFQSEGDLQNPVLLGDADYHRLLNNLTNGSTMTLDEARELSQAMMKGRHVYFGAIKQRKGARGFERNARWAIQHHIAASARYVALEPFKTSAINLFERAYGDYNKDFGKLTAQGFAKGYIDSVLGKPSEGEKLANKILNDFPPFRNMPRPAKKLAGQLSGVVGLLKLGASPAAAFVNVLQILNANMYLSPHKVAVGMKHAMRLSEADRAVLKACGTDDEVGLSYEGGFDRVRLEENSFTKAGDRYRAFSELAMKPFTAAESLIRRATTLAAYYDYMEKHGDMRDKEALRKRAREYALEINRKVNFDYSVADAPRIFRALQGTVVGDLALQFQKYGVKELEVIGDIFNPNIPAKRKVAFIVPYLLVGGLWNAAPFEDLLLSLVGLITGSDSPEDDAKKAMMEWAGNDPYAKAAVNLVNYGVGAAIPYFGFDISQRVGLKGVLPEGENMLKGGAFGSTVVGLGRAILNADAGGALRSASPFLGNVYQTVAGYGTDSKGRKTVDYDGYDRAMKLLGFRTVRDATAADYQNIVYNYKNEKRDARSKAKQAYLEEPSSDNYQRLRELGYTPKQIKSMGKEGNSTRISRAEKGLSKQDMKDLQGLRDFVY